GNEKTVRTGNRCGLLNANAFAAEVTPGRSDVADAQGEMARTERVGLFLQQQMNLLVAELKPEHDEIKRARLVDLLQTEHVSVEAAAALDIGDDDRRVIDLRDLQCCWH